MIYLVSGYMRTGTSMMMEALDAGGLEAVYSAERQALNDRWGGDGYVPNREYYELTAQQMHEWGFPRMHDGKLVKALFGAVPYLAPTDGMRVVFMRRHPEECRQSQEGFFKRTKAPPWLLALGEYEKRMALAVDHLKNRRDVLSVTEFQFRDVVADPASAFTELRDVGWPIDVLAAAAVPDPNLVRFKLERVAGRDMKEIVEHRDERTKVFFRGYDDDGNAEMRAVIAPVPIHYRDGDDVHDIRPEWDGLRLTGVPYTLEVDADRIGFTFGQHGKTIRAWLDYAGEITVAGHRLWWLDVRPDLDVCLIPSASNAALHFVLHSDKAPRIFSLHYEGVTPVLPQFVGRDNINDEVERPDADMWRELEIASSDCGDVIRTVWTGRVKAVDPVTRKRSWTTAVAYPVRIT